MFKRRYKHQQALLEYWVKQSLTLSHEIEDESLKTHEEKLLNSLNNLQTPRKIIAIGTSKSGKSSLLSGISQIPAIAQAAMAGPCTRWRNEGATDACEHSRFICREQLEGIELIDTQSIEFENVKSQVESHLPQSDVLLATLRADAQPLQSPLWDFLASLDERTPAACMLVLTFTQDLAVQELLVLREQIRIMAAERCVVDLPLYLLPSANDEASYEAIAQKIQERLDAPTGILSKLRGIAEQCDQLLHLQSGVLKARESLQRTSSGFLASIEQEIDFFQHRQLKQIPTWVEAYTQSIEASRATLPQNLEQRLSLCFTPMNLLHLDSMASKLEHDYFVHLSTELLNAQEEGDISFIMACKSHWQDVRPRMQTSLQCDIGQFNPQSLEGELEELRGKLILSLQQIFMQEQLRKSLKPFFRAPLKLMNATLVLACLTLIASGILGGLGYESYAYMGLIGSILIWALGCAALYLIRKRMIIGIMKASQNLAPSLSPHLADPLKQFALSRVVSYRNLYNLPRQKLAKQQEQLQPLQARHTQIFRQMHALMPHI